MASVNRRNKKHKKRFKKSQTKRWLSTPEAWTVFNAWAKVKALPKKTYEPEPVDRGPKKALVYFKKRLKIIAKSRKYYPLRCKTRAVSAKILKAKATLRTKQLACPRLYCCVDSCVERYITSAALNFVTSKHLNRLARPRNIPNETCLSELVISKAAKTRNPTYTDCILAIPKKDWSLELDDYKEQIKPYNKEWTDFLAIPKWNVLKYLESDKAKEWKENFVERLEARTKQAYDESRTKKKQLATENREKKSQLLSDEGGVYDKVAGQERSEEEDEEQNLIVSQPAVKLKKVPRTATKEGKEENKIEDPEKVKKRKVRKNAWRKKVEKCKTLPTEIPEAAKNYTASTETEKLAQPKKRREKCRSLPIKISDAAKNYTASPLTEKLAKPKYPPGKLIEPPKKRDVNAYGVPIIPKKPYGKREIKLLPFESKLHCPKAKDNDEIETEGDPETEGKGEEVQKIKKKKERSKLIEKSDDNMPFVIKNFVSHPVVNRWTIDPLFDKRGAIFQMKMRKKARKINLKKHLELSQGPKGIKNEALNKTKSELHKGEAAPMAQSLSLPPPLSVAATSVEELPPAVVNIAPDAEPE